MQSSKHTQELRKKIERYLVAEQPGWSVFISGFFFALLIGLILRASTHPSRIKNLLEKAVVNVHREVSVHIGDAYLSLANGWVPELAVVVRDVTLESKNQCWLSPYIDINQVKLPLNLLGLLSGRLVISEVNIAEMDLNLRTSLERCSHKDPSSNKEALSVKDGSPSGPAALLSSSGFASEEKRGGYASVSSSNRGNLEKISIDKIHVKYLPEQLARFELSNFQFQVKMAENPRYHLQGMMSFNHLFSQNDYLSQAKLIMDYVDDNQKSLVVQLNGNLREGHYDFKSKVSFANQEFQWDLDLKHIPVGVLIPALQKLRFVQNSFAPKQIWFSSIAHSQGNLQTSMKTPVLIPSIKVEGDLGELEVQNMHIHQLEPFKFQPVEVRVQKLSFQQLMNFVQRPHPHPALGELGTFTGTAIFSDDQKVLLKGEHQGLQFVFSNRGRREYQNFEMLKGEMYLQNQKWDIQIHTLRPQEGVMSGDLRIFSDRDWKEVKVLANIQELSFAPKVVSLMTHGGEMGPFSGDLQFHFSKGSFSSLSGQLKIDKIKSEGVEVDKSKWSLTTKEGIFHLDSQGAGLLVESQSPVGRYFSSVFQDLPQQEPLIFKNYQIKIQTDSLTDFSWKDFSATGAQNQLQSYGGWDKQGKLHGQLKLKIGSKKKSYEVRGTRSRPEILESSKK